MMRGRGNSFDIKVPWTSAAVMLLLLPQLARPDTDITPFESSSSCPKLLPQLFEGYVPAGESDKDKTAYAAVTNVTSTDSCVGSCCQDPSCQVAFMVRGSEGNFSCYKVSCTKSDLHCVPKRKLPETAAEQGWKLSVALVRPLHSQDKTWKQLLLAGKD